MRSPQLLSAARGNHPFLVFPQHHKQLCFQRSQDENGPRVQREQTTLPSFTMHTVESWKRDDWVQSSLCSMDAITKQCCASGSTWLHIKKQDKQACDTAVPRRRCGWSEKVCHKVTASPAQPNCRGLLVQSCRFTPCRLLLRLRLPCPLGFNYHQYEVPP